MNANVFGIVFATFLLGCLGCLPFRMCVGDELDLKAMDPLWNHWKAAGKSPVPVYSRNPQRPGTIQLEVQRMRAVGGQGVVAWGPIGWCRDCTWPLNEGDAFFNVGDAGTLVRIDKTDLAKGETAIFEKGRLIKVEKSSVNGQQLRLWRDVTGKFSVQARFVELDGDAVKLRRDDDRLIKVSLQKLSSGDRAFAEKQR